MDIGADGLMTGDFAEGGYRPGRLGGAERPAADRRRQWPEDGGRARRGIAQAVQLGLSFVRPARVVPTRRHGRNGVGLRRRSRAKSPWLAIKPLKIFLPRGSQDQADRQDRLCRPAAGAGRRGRRGRAAQGLARNDVLALDAPLKTQGRRSRSAA